jgi:putative tricarboxylic transport membrane protein
LRSDDRISSLVWLAFGIFICAESLRLPLGSWRDPGAGFLPLGSGIFLILLSLVNFFRARQERSRPQVTWYSKKRRGSLIFILVGLLGYAFCLEILGFLVSTFLLLLLLFRYVEPQRWSVSIGASALAAIISYAIFEIWLKTQLPRGIWGF